MDLSCKIILHPIIRNAYLKLNYELQEKGSKCNIVCVSTIVKRNQIDS